MKLAGVAVGKASVCDFFALFELPRSCFIDLDLLEKNYLKLQQKIHQRNTEDIEQNSLQINEGYEILKDQFKRLKYLFSLLQIPMDKNIDPEKLEGFLDLQEQISKINSSAKYAKLKEKLDQKRAEILQKIEHKLFTEKNFEQAADSFPQFSFLHRLSINLESQNENLY